MRLKSTSCEINVRTARPGFGKAHWTAQIAIRGNFDQRDAGMLFVFRAQAAIERTAAVGLGAVLSRRSCGLIVFVAIVVRDIGADEVFNHSMLWTLLAEIYPSITHDDLGVHDAPTRWAQASRRASKNVVADIHGESLCLTKEQNIRPR